MTINLIKYFNVTLLNEFLLNHFLAELLNNREILTLPQQEYSQRANTILNLLLNLAEFSKIYYKEDIEEIFKCLQSNYSKYFTKDPQKINNYSLFGNLLVNFYLTLIYENNIRVRSQFIFEAIHQRRIASQFGHKEKSIYTAFFIDLLDKNFQLLYPEWKLTSTKRLFTLYQVK
jgi:hypothetical protein